MAAIVSTSGPIASIERTIRIALANCSRLLRSEGFFLLLLAREGFDHPDAGEGLLHRHDHLAHVFLLVA